MLRFAIAFALSLFLLTLPRRLEPIDPLPGFPRIVLWAWERPENLLFINPSRSSVAFLARTVMLTHNGVQSRPRLQPLRVAPSTPLMAVVRIESEGQPLPPLAPVVEAILKAKDLPGVRALQIDFDARRSERSYYTALLWSLRRSLPPATPLGITALASWCESDPWIRTLPISFSVPMLFRMGAGETHPAADFSSPICRSAVGVSTDEIPPRIPRGRRLFFFNPRPWSPSAYQAALAEARRWQ